MGKQWIVILLIMVMGTAGANTFKEDLEYSVPSESGTKYFGTLKKNTGAVLTVTVTPDPGWVFVKPKPECTHCPAQIKKTGTIPGHSMFPKTLKKESMYLNSTVI